MKTHYAVDTVKVIDERNNQVIKVHLIVLKDDHGCVQSYTGIETYCHFYMSRKRIVSEYFYWYVCTALNYLRDECNIRKLADITPKMIEAFFEVFKGRTGSNGAYVGKQALERCIISVSHFAANLAEASTQIPYGWKTYLKKTDNTGKYGNRRTSGYESVYAYIKPLQGYRKDLLRDIPLDVVDELIVLARIYDPMIAFAIVLGYLAGLRGGEIVNVLQPDSPLLLKDCITYTPTVGPIQSIKIDLNKEIILRSDGIITGGIKKERTVDVFNKYFSKFDEAYHFHLNLLVETPCEEEFRPMFVGQNGKAMTVQTLRNRFQALVANHLRPTLLQSSNPEWQALGNMLLNNNLGLHVLRHCFTIKLLFDCDNLDLLQHYRGDSNTDSAKTYYNNKSMLVQQAQKSHELAINDLAQSGLQKVKNEGIL